ncbi:hypothetical protein PG985_007511 [Apiospora marii]|uniref:Uncharacterized protein n=1 Tax=Apiospora marii TaxID=335849 RepID=A0ABR1SND6_9PEZI
MATSNRVPSPVGSIVPRATPTSACAGSGMSLQKPPPWSKAKVGQKITIGWNGGPVGSDPDQKTTAAWKAYLARSEDPKSPNTTIFDTKTFVAGDAGWDPEERCGGSQMEYEWTIPADLLPDNVTAIYRYLLVKESEDGQPSPTESVPLPSTSIGGYFSILPATASIWVSPTPTPAPGLSPGEKAGIGVGVGVGALSCLAAGVYFLRRRRRRRRINGRRTPTKQEMSQMSPADADEGQVRWDKAELDAGRELEMQRQRQRALEADGRPLAELTAETAQGRNYRPQGEPVELPGSNVV